MPGGLYRNHFNAVRVRALGSGSLDLSLQTLDDLTIVNIEPITLSNAPGRYFNQLVNLTTQKARVHISTNEIDEVFTIRQIIVYVKPIATGFPQ